jgi:hypothetical protein
MHICCFRAKIVSSKRGVKHLDNLIENLKRAKRIAQIKDMCLLDDDFMTKCFEEDLKCTEFVLRIVLDISDLVVTEAKTQNTIKSLQGRSVRLDIRAACGNGKIYNIEVERSDKRASPRRIRYNACIIDSNSILPGDDVELLPEPYIIMIPENDYWSMSEPIYTVKKQINDTGIVYDDGLHVLYVNCSYNDDPSEPTPLGKLIHDFNCKNASDMYNPILANRVRYFKEDEKGVAEMCKIVEDYVKEEKREIAKSIIKDWLMSIEAIAQKFGFTIEEVEELRQEA